MALKLQSPYLIRRLEVRYLLIVWLIAMCSSLCLSRTMGQSPQWDLLNPDDAPSARYDHSMAYDVDHEVIVLFGGEANGNFFGDTWLWDGATWTQVATTGPSPSARARSAMAFDSVRHRVVLFGGWDGQHFGDTWEWDGAAWTLIPTGVGPSTRRDHVMAYDAANQKVVLFGGYSPTSGGFDGETWLWDGNTWTHATTAGPSRRYTHGMAFDEARQRVVLFGGFNPDAGYLNDTWMWDGLGWTEQPVAPPLPSARQAFSMAYDSYRQRTVLFGGFDGALVALDGETWEWDGTGWALNVTVGPNARYRHRAAYDAARCSVVLFGGADPFPASPLGDTWRYTSDSDGDDVADACDNCPTDPNKTAPGICGCGADDTIGFVGFLPPIGGADATGGSFADPLRAFKLGSTIPVKFTASQCGGPLLTGIHTLRAVKYSSAVDSDPAIDATPTDAATTGNQFRLTDGKWHFNLSTRTGFSTGTWNLIATLSDGSIHYAWITIKK